MREILYIELDWHELEDIVNKTYSITQYNFVAVQECRNDSQHTFQVTKQEPLDEWESKDLQEFIAKNGLKEYMNYTIMQDLVNRGVLKPANYLVTVSW